MGRSRWGILSLATAAVVGVAVGATLATQLPGNWLTTDDSPLPDDVRPKTRPLRSVFEGPDARRETVAVTLVPMVADVGQPTDLAFVPGHPDRLVVASKWGSLHLIDLADGLREFWVWLEVDEALECGILGVALHPEFERNGRFFVNHVPEPSERRATVVSEFRVNPHTLRRPRRVADLIAVPQPEGTHNGGQIAFGPDGMLYVALGDGAAGGNPYHTAQDRGSLLGSLLRLDVSKPGTYRVPPDNPFVGVAGVRPEIWAYGLRNPWRFTFDPRGRMVVGDVGQASWEEVDLVAAGDNLGWSVREGAGCYDATGGCRGGGMVDPVYAYGHLEGVSITGGVVWEAGGVLDGAYVFGDFGTGRLWALRLPERVEPIDDVIALGRFEISPTAFARDVRGRVWVADFRGERVFRIDPVPER